MDSLPDICSVDQEDILPQACWILYESGSDEHAYSSHFGYGDNDRGSSIKLRSISGHRLHGGTTRAVHCDLFLENADHQLCHADYQVGPVQKMVLSAGKLLDRGFQGHLGKGESYLECVRTGTRIPMYKYGNSFYLRAQIL